MEKTPITMSQLNFKKMYLISCEKYDTLKTTSAQTNNSSSSILPTSQISDNSDTERVIDLEVRSSSQQKKGWQTRMMKEYLRKEEKCPV